MGCGSSKVDDLPLVELCRERKDLIRAAADHRYALASAHFSYFQALNGIGEALHRFVQEELTVVSTPSSSSKSMSSPVLTIPSSEGKHRRKHKHSSGDAVGEVGASSSSPTSPSHSLSPDDFHHLHLSSDSVSEASLEEDEEAGARGSGGEPSSSTPFPVMSSPNYYYMRRSTAIPSTVYEPQYPEYAYANPLYGENQEYYGVPVDSGSGYPPYGRNGSYFGAPMSYSSPPRHDPYYYYDRPVSPPRAPAPPARPSPPPPPPEGSTWDFLNPFGSYEQIYSRYGLVSQVSSPNSSEVREQEGIPDLEDETEPEIMKEFNKAKKVDNGGEEKAKDSGVGSSKPPPAQLHEKDVKESSGEKEIKSGLEGRNTSSGEASKSRNVKDLSSSNSSKEENAAKKEVSFEAETSPTTENSWPSIGAALSTQGTKDVTEVVMEIKEQFKMAAGSGEELSAMLEVGKLRYHSRNTLFRVISSRILDSVPILTYSRTSSKQGLHSGASTSNTSKATNGGLQNVKSGNLSSTLDKLYVWEKKLYKQVKDEEWLRVEYEKKFKLLKVLDDRGAESNKIETAEASIKKLHTKLDIAIKSIDAIAGRIHKLRDEELQPQLNALIQGLIKMWKFMLYCHQKQFLAIVDSKSRNLMAKTGIQRSSVAKTTIELEMELLNWSSSFSNWIRIQKSYVEALNGWLLKCLHEEPEETPDGVPPFSPSRIGAPSIFIVCNDWYQAVNRISEVDVSTAMHSFAATVHELWETQDDEQRQKLKAEYLSRDLSRRLKSLQKESGMHGQQVPSGGSVVSVSDNTLVSSDNPDPLDLMRKRLEEERARHEETVKQVHEAASKSLRTGLIPIFGALGNFTLETLKAYEGVRIHRIGEGT